MIVFHGSPNYFNKFKDNKIGTSRDYNPVQGHYFSEKMTVAFSYSAKYLFSANGALCFIDTPAQPITGYLYVCEVPDKTELLDLSQEITEAPESVQAAINNILKDPAFSGGYFKRRKDNTLAEFVARYIAYCEATKIYSMLPNVFRGYKGVTWTYTHSSDERPEIIIFNADDIKIKQCFIIDRIPPEEGTETYGIIRILFKRFDKYYYAYGMFCDTDKDIVFLIDTKQSKLMAAVRSFEQLEKNPFVIAYAINKTTNFTVTEANISSLNYNPRKNTSQKKISMYSAEDIKAQLNKAEHLTPVRSKILNPTEFAEYKRQADSYKYMGKYNPYIYNCISCDCHFPRVNVLFLQETQTPYYNIPYRDPDKAALQYKAHKANIADKPVRESEHKLTDEQIQEKTKEFLKVLKPIIKERIKTLYNLPDETEKQ